MLIDTHLHIIDRSALPYPWLSQVADLDHDFLYETYAAEARRCGITTVLHMEVDVDPAAMAASLSMPLPWKTESVWLFGRVANATGMFKTSSAVSRPTRVMPNSRRCGLIAASV